MKRIIYLLLLCNLSAFAQKSSQVREYLGQRYETEKPTGVVTFRFEKGVLRRTGDGSKTWADLLTHVTAYSDASNAGALLNVQVAGKNVQPVIKTNLEAAGSAQPIPEKYGGGSETILWDSATTAIRIEEMKRDFDQKKGVFLGQSMQWWNFVMYIANSIFYILLCFLGLCRYAAVAATNEYRIDSFGNTKYGRWVVGFGIFATSITFFITMLVMCVFLLNIFTRLSMGDIAGIFGIFFSWNFALVLGWFFILHQAGKITDWVVPNPKVRDNGGQVVIQNRQAPPPLNHRN